MSHTRIHLVLAAVGLLALAACKSQEAPGAGFAQADQMTRDPTLPFHKVWRRWDFDLRQYGQLHIAPVNTDFMLSLTDWQKGERKDQIVEDTRKLAAYAHNSLTKAFTDDPAHRFQLVDTPGRAPGTLILEMALTEVVPSKVTLNTLSFALPFGLGVPVNAVRAMAKDQSSVAIEARLRDAATGEVIAMFADREVEQAAPVTVRAFTWYSHAESIIDTWSLQFVQIANRKAGETIRDREPFTLSPW